MHVMPGADEMRQRSVEHYQYCPLLSSRLPLDLPVDMRLPFSVHHLTHVTELGFDQHVLGKVVDVDVALAAALGDFKKASMSEPTRI
jgi:hypothetical protein